MATNKGFYSVYDYGDSLHPADRIKIEHSIYVEREKSDISQLTALPLERLQAMRGESAEKERAVFEKIRASTSEWEEQAAQTKLFDNAIEYVRTPPVKHTSNQWQQDSDNRDRNTISNMVYAMSYNVYERNSYGHSGRGLAPKVWELTWYAYAHSPGDQRTKRIAGQDKKVYSDKADMERYLAGRIKAYSHLFTEISPPIPQEYANNFRVNGQLLPGYTVEGEEPVIPAPAAVIENGGDSVSQNTEQRKERETMYEPLNIQLANREQYITRESGGVEGAWLKLPATAEQLQSALARIGTANGEQEFFINGIETPVAAVAHLSLENIQKAGIDELNYLAAALQARDDKQIDKLNAASEMIPDRDDVHALLELTQNTGVYDIYPGIASHVQLGEHLMDNSGVIQIPDEWAAAVDIEMLGRLAAEHDKGIFTEYGYIVSNGEEWKPVTEIPQEYRISPAIEDSNKEQDAVTAPAQAAVKPRQGEQAAPVDKAAPAVAMPAAAPIIPLVLTAESPRDRMKEITDKLEAGIKGIFDSEKYKTYLHTLSKFHNYSFNNCILIAMQSPGASHVAGFNAWRDDFKRQVRKGEKGIKILAPAPFKTKKTVDAVDKNGKPLFDKSGKRLKEEKEITVPAFKITTVFDISQTDGEPLPQLGVNELNGSVDKYKEFFAALEKVSPVPVGFEAIKTGAKGFYQLDEKRIAINEGMSELQNLKTLIHEIAHARIHDIDKNAPKDTPRPDRRTREVEAESIAYTVCQRYGLDTSDYSFAYVATWSGAQQLDTLKASLDTIRKEAAAIIGEVDKQLAEVTQDRAQTAEQTAPEQPEPQGGTFTIYQLKEVDATRDLRFEPLDTLKAPPDAANYDKVYAAPLESGVTLDMLHERFNIDLPQDFKGHSLSISDIVIINRDGKDTAHYVDSFGFKELPVFLPVKEPARETPAVNLAAVAGYMQKLNDGLQAVTPDSPMSVGAYNFTVKRLEQSNERIPDTQPQLKALIMNAAQSPDFATLKERMATLHTEFTQHYSTAVQITLDTSGKAEPKAPAAAPTRQSDPAPAPKPPAQGENVAAIEAKVKAGETINLSDLSDAIKKDKQAEQTGPKQSRTNTRSRAPAKAAAPEKPSIREQIAAGKQELSGQKPAPSRAAAKDKNAVLGG